MIRHIFQLVWNKKRSNALLFLEVFFAFAILFLVLTWVTRNLRMYSTPIGFETENTWIVHLDLFDVEDTLAAAEAKDRLRNELLSLQEIEAASYGGYVSPFGGSTWSTNNDDNGFQVNTHMVFADEHYQEVANLELVQGRWFEETDKDARYKPVVISKKLFEESFKGRNLKDSVYTINEENKIIGVIDHYKYHGDFAPEYNVSFFYQPSSSIESSNLHLRLAPGTPVAFEEKVNRIVADVTGMTDFTIEHLQKSRERQARSIWIPMISMLSICGFLVLNVALGLFGVLWYNISKRRAEVGLRRTLGASRMEVSLQFVGEIMVVSLLALLLGLIFAVQLPLMGVLEGEIMASDYYVAMGIGVVFVIALVLLCTLYPSQEAGRLQPAIVLHEE
ncbi:MAG: ABC transporter permease [Phaeodactylibacter sp.]|nr:ABC transporter permease [Phaeodactylibacter sp.]